MNDIKNFDELNTLKDLIKQKNNEIDILNSKINEIVIDFECKLADQQHMHEHCITNLESNKVRNEEILELEKNEMEARIQDFQEKLTQFRKSLEVVEVK
jgi:hypothetical protein